MHNASPRVVVAPADDGQARRDFIDVPYLVQGGNPNWVPPLRAQQREVLDTRRNPTYRHARIRLFVAYHGGQPAGRIAAIDDDIHNATHHEKATLWGFFECVNDQAVADALFAAVEAAARSLGHDVLRGPFSPSVKDEIGLQIDGFETPNYVMIPGNPPYYQRLVEAAGHAKDIDLYCLRVDERTVSTGLEQRARAALARGHITYRKITKASLDADALKIWAVYNSAWEKNWLWVKATREEFLDFAGKLKQIADYDLNFVAETAAGDVVGFAVAIPNVNEALVHVRDGRLWPLGWLKLLWYSRPGAIRSLRFLAMGVLEPYRRQGIDVVLNYHQFVEARRKGYVRAEMSQILEDNTPMLRAAAALGGERYKTHRMYVRRLRP